MALRALIIGKKLMEARGRLEKLREKDEEFQTREAELEEAISEAESEEDQEAVEKLVEEFETEKEAHEEEKKKLEEEISDMESELEEIAKEPAARMKKQVKEKRGESRTMETRKKFFGMDAQERDAFFANEEVKEFLQRARDLAIQKRTITGAELTIPTQVLELIRENVENYSKLVNRVRVRYVSGKARQNVMGAFPEAVWTEACASLNELSFGFTQTELDGYKVGGIIYICIATLEDSDYDLASEIITALGAAIGIALDKAILYGTGVKMPLGIVSRLAQDSQPSDYPTVSRPWEDLSGTNLITISGKTGLALFQELAKSTKVIKGKYSRGVKFWAMNESTYTDLMVEAMSINAAGAIVSAQGATMPVVGGDIVVLSDDIITDGNIIVGYGDLYLLAERAGSSFARSDEYRFADDQVAFKGTARYDGAPIIAEGFAAIGIGSAPATDATFPGDTANDTTLTDLSIGSLSLSPTFNPETLSYTATATAASDAVTANPTQARAKVTLTYNGKNYPNGGSVKWLADSTAHPLEIEVENGVSVRTYTVQVTKGE
jgi:HK97 family phage major capsid protein|nr:MAG TPA: major capsid protein [Caudoviricetes sp.]